MLAMITTQKKFLKLDKIGPNTRIVFSTVAITTETNLVNLDFSLHTLSTNNVIRNILSPQSYNLLY